MKCEYEDETDLVKESGINFYYQLGILTLEEALERLKDLKKDEKVKI